MNKAEQNFRLLQEIDASRIFLLMAYRQNPKLLEGAEVCIRQLFEEPVSYSNDEIKSGRLISQRGFTIVELITVIIIIGIIGAVAASKFFDRSAYDSRGFHDQVISTLRFAQKSAIAKRRYVCVAFTTSSSITLTYDPTPPSTAYAASTCTTTNPMTSPAGNSPFTVSSTTTTLSGYSNFYFDALGRPFPAQSIGVSGDANITVVAETGYVY